MAKKKQFATMYVYIGVCAQKQHSAAIQMEQLVFASIKASQTTPDDVINRKQSM